MALTIFVFLDALFFMAFFSVFICNFAEDESTADISFSRPTRRISSSPPRPHFNRRRGLDSEAVRSLPVYRYTKSAKHWIEDCIICLSNFEEAARCCRIRNQQRAAVRRCSSCSSLGQRTGLERSLSL
ncbi:hypothetical protein DY000_02030452 [Brassica cretica]|uniref:Secreted protein n=1 Tax=Brassica cretica TaxID=69181 RepID=A0ABQ7DKR8_BRACR|nr:hypothetical protein DY000_02030452 [Brassica cretica]